MPQQGRTGGGGYTVFLWQGHLLAMAESVTVTGPRPVAEAVAIQPLNAVRPIEIITSGAQGPGTIQLTLTELFSNGVWEKLAGLADTQDIADIMRVLAAQNNGIVIQRVIWPYWAGSAPLRYEEYLGCTVTEVQDDETVDIRTVRVDKQMTIMFTRSRKSWMADNRKDRENMWNQISGTGNNPTSGTTTGGGRPT